MIEKLLQNARYATTVMARENYPLTQQLKLLLHQPVWLVMREEIFLTAPPVQSELMETQLPAKSVAMEQSLLRTMQALQENGALTHPPSTANQV